MNADSENKLLARITLITSFGDFLAYFSTLMMVYELSQSVAVSAYTVVVKSLAIGLGGLLFPKIATHFYFRTLLFVTQAVSGVAGLALGLYWGLVDHRSPLVIFALLFVQSFLKQLFEAARESRSKIIAQANQHRSFQTDLLHSFYTAQFIGPVLSFFIIKYFHILVPVYLDALSFFICAVLALQVGKTYEVESYGVFRPLSYLHKNPKMLRIFLIRSIGMWIPISIFNYSIFPVVQNHFNLNLLNSVWIYVAVGLGSFAATSVLRKKLKLIEQTSDWRLAQIGFFCIAITRLGFANLNSFYLALGVLSLGGFFNGMNAAVTQSLRRTHATSKQLPEIIGLELVVAKVTDWLTATSCFFLLSRQIVPEATLLYVSALGFVGLIPLMGNGGSRD